MSVRGHQRRGRACGRNSPLPLSDTIVNERAVWLAFFDTLTSVLGEVKPPRHPVHVFFALFCSSFRSRFCAWLLPFGAGLLTQNMGAVMARKLDYDRDEVHDETILERFVWLSEYFWDEYLSVPLPDWLRQEIRETLETDQHNNIIFPRIIYMLLMELHR